MAGSRTSYERRPHIKRYLVWWAGHGTPSGRLAYTTIQRRLQEGPKMQSSTLVVGNSEQTIAVAGTMLFREESRRSVKGETTWWIYEANKGSRESNVTLTFHIPVNLSHPRKRVPCKEWSFKPLQTLLAKGQYLTKNGALKSGTFFPANIDRAAIGLQRCH